MSDRDRMTGGETPDEGPDEIDLLMPWHAVERLSPEDAERVAAALALEPARARHLAAVREERAETVALNQDLGLPSHAAREALFARIGKDGLRADRSGTLARRVGGWLAGLAPSTLAWSGAAAALVIALQAGLLANAYRGPAPAGYETAAGPDAATQAGGHALVAFAPTATAAEIDALLREAGAVIVDGPRAGGLYRLRLAAGPAGASAKSIEQLRTASRVVMVVVVEGDGHVP